MGRKYAGAPFKRRKFKVQVRDGEATGPVSAAAPVDFSTPDEAPPPRAKPIPAPEERAPNYLEEEAQRPFTPEVFLIKKGRR